MYAEERQGMIVERARDEGRVEVASLASALEVSLETVRRDLGMLEKHGVLRRTHGGAVPVERLRFEPEVSERESEQVAEKARIAEAALEFLPDRRGTVALDAGTTTAAFANLLPAGRELTVLTNCLPIARTLASDTSVKVMMCGGRVRSQTFAAVGEAAARFLDEFAPDVAFVGTNGVSPRRGFTTPDEGEAAAKRALVRGAARVVALADSTKAGREDFVRFGRPEEVDVLITDSGIDAEMADELERAGMEVLRV